MTEVRSSDRQYPENSNRDPAASTNTGIDPGQAHSSAGGFYKIKPLPNGSNSPSVGYPPRPPLTRIDSRGSFPIRPGFPNHQGVPNLQGIVNPQNFPNSHGIPIRQPNQPIRQLPPGTPFAQRPPGIIPNRPPFQPPFPNNQGNPNIQPQLQGQVRPGVPSNWPGSPLPPRGITPGPRPPGLAQQRSDLSLEQQRRDSLTRSQTLDSTEVINSSPNIANLENNAPSTMNIARNNSMKSASNSLHSSNSNLNEEPQRSISRNSSIEEKRFISNSQESLDRKSEHEYPSRPESRAGSRMSQISEDPNLKKNSNPPPSASDNQRPESRNSLSGKPPLPPSASSVRENHQEDTNKTKIPPVTKSTNDGTEEQTKSSLQLKNIPKAKSPIRIEGDNDSGVDESTQGNDRSSNGDANSPRKSASKPPKRISSATPSKGRSLSRDSMSPSLKSPDSTATTPGTTEKKKLPMNKIQVGSAPSPNLKEVRSKIGSLQNTTYKPGGGNVKIENKKIELKNVTPRIEAKNDKYISKGGEKKIVSQKLQWNAKSKIGSLENTSHKPVSSGKKIETVKLDFKEKAKPKVGSKDNMKHIPGGGDIKIENKKIEFQVQSKVGSLDNVKHKPKGGDKKIFDDKDYLRQMSAISSENHSLSGSQKKKRPDAMMRETYSSLDFGPRYLETVREEVSVIDSRPASRISGLSRSNSARYRSCSTPRPRWKY